MVASEIAEPAVEWRDVAPLWPDPTFVRQLRESGIVLINDTREHQKPLVYQNLRSVVQMLPTGDVSIVGAQADFTIELKKTLDDLAGCVGYQRERFTREMQRLERFSFKRLLIVGSEEAILRHDYHSEVTGSAILGSLHCWQIRYGVPFVFAKDATEAARLCEIYAFYFATKIVKKADRFLKAQKSIIDQPF
jgi:DNA excision repair protein ERCC-4